MLRTHGERNYFIRTWTRLLVVTLLRSKCSPFLHGCQPGLVSLHDTIWNCWLGYGLFLPIPQGVGDFLTKLCANININLLPGCGHLMCCFVGSIVKDMVAKVSTCSSGGGGLGASPITLGFASASLAFVAMAITVTPLPALLLRPAIVLAAVVLKQTLAFCSVGVSIDRYVLLVFSSVCCSRYIVVLCGSSPVGMYCRFSSGVGVPTCCFVR
jgi:hypothetical protein